MIATFEGMKLPGGNRAVVDRTKLTDYCLNEHHPRGKHKARVFVSVLGLTAESVDVIRTALLRAAVTEDAVLVGSDRFGERYVIDFQMEGPRGSGLVRSLWIIRTGENFPRLTSCYVL